jgi:hypothetical protein
LFPAFQVPSILSTLTQVGQCASITCLISVNAQERVQKYCTPQF